MRRVEPTNCSAESERTSNSANTFTTVNILSTSSNVINDTSRTQQPMNRRSVRGHANRDIGNLNMQQTMRGQRRPRWRQPRTPRSGSINQLQTLPQSQPTLGAYPTNQESGPYFPQVAPIYHDINSERILNELRSLRQEVQDLQHDHERLFNIVMQSTDFREEYNNPEPRRRSNYSRNIDAQLEQYCDNIGDVQQSPHVPIRYRDDSNRSIDLESESYYGGNEFPRIEHREDYQYPILNPRHHMSTDRGPIHASQSRNTSYFDQSYWNTSRPTRSRSDSREYHAYITKLDLDNHNKHIKSDKLYRHGKLPINVRKPIFYIDSGCSHHVVNDISLLDNVRIRKSNQSLGCIVGCTPNSTITIEAVGDIANLGKAFYAPLISNNLLSVAQLDTLGYKVSFGDGKCIAMRSSSDENSIITGTLTNQNHYECRIKLRNTDLDVRTVLDSSLTIPNNIVVNCLMMRTEHDWPETIHPREIEIFDIPSSESLPAGLSSDEIGPYDMILDSAAKTHVVNTTDLMPKVYGMDFETLARLPNGETIEVVGYGRTMLLESVHYIPGSRFNLLSISQFTKHGGKVIFHRNHASISLYNC